MDARPRQADIDLGPTLELPHLHTCVRLHVWLTPAVLDIGTQPLAHTPNFRWTDFASIKQGKWRLL